MTLNYDILVEVEYRFDTGYNIRLSPGNPELSRLLSPSSSDPLFVGAGVFIDPISPTPPSSYATIEDAITGTITLKSADLTAILNDSLYFGTGAYAYSNNYSVYRKNLHEDLDDKQPLHASLTSISGVGSSTGDILRATGSSSYTNLPMHNFMASCMSSANGAALAAAVFAGTTSQYVRGDGSTATLPTIPTKTSDLTNDAGFITSAPVTSVNGHTGIVSVSKSDVSLGNVPNVDATVAANITQDSTHRFATDSEKTTWNGKQTQLNGTGFVKASGTSVSYDNSTYLTAIPTKTFNFPTRSLNSAFQISTTQDTTVSYSVDIACSLSLTGGQAGTVYLRYADDSGHTTNVKEVCRISSSNTGSLTIGLALNQVNTGTLSGTIPAGKYVKLVTVNDTGTPTFTYRNAQEVLL